MTFDGNFMDEKKKKNASQPVQIHQEKERSQRNPAG